MKKLLSFAGLALAAMLFFACVPDKNVVPRADYTDPELEVTPDTLNLSQTAGSSATAKVTTDQTKIEAEVDYSVSSWLSAKVEGTNVVATAEANNKTGVVRVGRIRVIVGEKGTTKETTIVVLQQTGTPDELNLSKEAVEFTDAASQSEVITYTTNLGSITVSQPEDSKAWLGVTNDATTITLTTLTANTAETDRTAQVSVTAGDLTKKISVVQKGLAPTLELSAESVTLKKEVDSEASVTYTTNQGAVSATVEATAQSWLSATVGDGTITFKALSANTEFAVRSAKVTVSAGSITKEVAVTQNGESYLGTVYNNEAIVFWVDPENPLHVMVVSAKAEKKAFCTERDRVDGVSSLTTYIEMNNVIRQKPGYPNDYPAFKYCEDMGEGWYIPVESQMKDLTALYCGVATFDDVYTDGVATAGPAEQLAARKAFDALLVSLPGGVALNSAYDGNGDSNWLCRETTGGKGYCYRWGKIATINNAAKDGTSRYARCVKEVTIQK